MSSTTDALGSEGDGDIAGKAHVGLVSDFAREVYFLLFDAENNLWRYQPYWLCGYFVVVFFAANLNVTVGSGGWG